MSNIQQNTACSGENSAGQLEVAIIGAGFAGMYMLYCMRKLGLSARIYEAGSGVGGTWYWNRYPGARCDVESIQYSYQFSEELQQEWEWTEKYSPQPDILRYANHVADRFDLRRDIQCNTRVMSAVFNEDSHRWDIQTETGDRISAAFCVMATGCLSSSNTPAFKGIRDYKGNIYHTGKWPHDEVSFNDMTVGVIGTGSSAIQAIPVFASQADHLFVFQRTPNYTVPAHNAALDPEYVRDIKSDYAGLRARAKTKPSGYDLPIPPLSAVETSPEDRFQTFESKWQNGGVGFMAAFNDLLVDAAANETAAEFVRKKIRETVDDPKIAKLLSPDNVIGCKRLCVDTNYWETFNLPNVTLVDVSRTPIEKISQNGLCTNGQEYPLDAIVFATGFDAMTGALLNIDIRGRGGQTLQTKWEGGPKTYLGLAMADFPNLFTITGPGSPSVLTNMLPSIEQHVEWITDCISHMHANGLECIEANREAENEWVEHVNQVADLSLRSTCSSWYIGANIEGKARVFMPYIGGFPKYVEKCNNVVANDYEGFILN
ncbi:MAG: Phenylacetone monooxygenase [Alphaproteobacteria bacterium MarineAlpha9_Bin7]|nr:MAG: Phenylacetone monooxygenase [Alphaproteobacteria bacterium MarineAlpha9_Bin7]